VPAPAPLAAIASTFPDLSAAEVSVALQTAAAAAEHPISFRIKAEIKQTLERLAKEDRRSLSSYFELAL